MARATTSQKVLSIWVSSISTTLKKHAKLTSTPVGDFASARAKGEKILADLEKIRRFVDRKAGFIKSVCIVALTCGNSLPLEFLD